MNKIIILAIFFCISAMATEKDIRTPLEAFYGDTQFALIECGISFRLFQVRSKLNENGAGEANDPDSDYLGCIDKNLKKTALIYRRAAKKVINKPKAAGALKSYYAAWISALHGISPGDDETKLTYAARQTAAQNRLIELWAAVGIELLP